MSAMTSCGDGTLTPQGLEVNSSFEPVDIWRRWFQKSDTSILSIPSHIKSIEFHMQHVAEKHYDLGARIINERLTHSPDEK